MRGVIAIVRTTLRQLLGGRRLLVLALLGTVPAIVTWLSTQNRSADSVFEVYHEGAMITMFLIVMPIVSIVLGSAALGDERRDGTLSFLVVRPLPRSAITFAKFAAAWIASAAVAMLSGALASTAASLRLSDWSTMAPTLMALALSAGCYAAVFMVLGFLTSRAVLVGLIYLFVWESGIAFAASSLANVSLFRIGLTAYAAMLPEATPLLSDPLAALEPGTGGAIAKLAGLAAICAMTTTFLMRRRDIT